MKGITMKKMKTLLSSIVVAALAVGMTACSGSDNGKSAGGKDGATYRVAYVARAQADSYAAWLADEMKKAAEKYPDIKLEVFDGQADDETENKMIENAVANGFDGIIVQPNNGEAQRAYVEQAVAGGLKVITTNAKIDNIEGSSTVDSNPYDQAAGVAKVALEKVPKNAKVVVLLGPAGNFHSSERRVAWQKEFFDKRPDVKIIAEDIANWNKNEAMAFMEDWTTAHGKIDAVISMNDNMAAGAIEVVKNDKNYADMQAYGTDGVPEATLLIKEGKLTATVLQDAKELAELNMAGMHALLTGEKKKVEDSISNPLIDSSNVQKYIDLYTELKMIK